jgi:hypothetical protein
VSGLVTIGGVTAESLGVSLTGLPDGLSAPEARWDSLVIPQRAGALLTRTRPQVAPRELVLDLVLRGTDIATAADQLDTLKAAIHGRPAAIVFSWDTGRQYLGYIQSVRAEPWLQTAVDGWLRVQVVALIPSAYAEDVTETTATDTPATPIDVLVGTGPTEPVIRIIGPATNPIITAKDEDGTTIGTLSFTIALGGSSDVLVVDCREGGSAYRDNAGTITDAVPLLSPGFSFPVFWPDNADYVTPDWPTLESSSGASMQVIYRRQWL